MNADSAPEVLERLARLHAPSSNGADTAQARLPSADDLDWVLFHSFPECEVAPSTFAELVPVYERALRGGAQFDYELLFVRVLELSGSLGLEALRAVARAGVERVLSRGFDHADSIAALRFALRTLPGSERFLDDVLQREQLAAFRFHWTLDFVLDERGLAEYLALSYLRDDDPATADLLREFPVPETRLEQLRTFFEPEACCQRIEMGWDGQTSAEERAALAAAVSERLPRFGRHGSS